MIDYFVLKCVNEISFYWFTFQEFVDKWFYRIFVFWDILNEFSKFWRSVIIAETDFIIVIFDIKWNDSVYENCMNQYECILCLLGSFKGSLIAHRAVRMFPWVLNFNTKILSSDWIEYSRQELWTSCGQFWERSLHYTLTKFIIFCAIKEQFVTMNNMDLLSEMDWFDYDSCLCARKLSYYCKLYLYFYLFVDCQLSNIVI